MSPETRRLVCLSLAQAESTNSMMDMLLSKKRAGDRKQWLETKGNLAVI
jgi:topoisomerase-4 subunit B